MTTKIKAAEIIDLTVNMEADDPDMVRFATFAKKFAPESVTEDADGSVTISCREDVLLALLERFKSEQGEPS